MLDPVCASTARMQVAVHDLHQRRHQPGADRTGDRGTGVLGTGEGGDHGARRGRLRPERQGRLGDDAERALRPDDQLGQVVSGDALDGPPAGPQHLARGEHHLQAEHRVGGHAVFHAAQAAGVGREIAAQRAPVVGGRVGCVEQSAGFDLGAESRG